MFERGTEEKRSLLRACAVCNLQITMVMHVKPFAELRTVSLKILVVGKHYTLVWIVMLTSIGLCYWNAELMLWSEIAIGGKSCGKTIIIRRYIANQFIAINDETQHSEPQRTSGSSHLAELSTHTLKVPGRNDEVVSITFWEIPSTPLAYMKEQYYGGADAVLIGESCIASILHC